MAYKEKQCPKCGVMHNKRGEFCSRSCGNVREWNKDQREAVSSGLRKWHATSDTADVASYNFISKRDNAPPEPVEPPAVKPIGLNQFVQDGDLWTEV